MSAINFARAFVRPYAAYILVTIFGGLAVFAFVKYGNEHLAEIVIIAFIEMVGILAAFYFGQRQKTTTEEKPEK